MCQALCQVLGLLGQDSGHALSPVVAPAHAFKQPKGCSMPQLVSEYLRVAPVRLEHFPDLKDKSCLRKAAKL